MDLYTFKGPFQDLPGHHRSCTVMDKNIIAVFKALEPGGHGMISFLPSGNNFLHLGEPVPVHNLCAAVIDILPGNHQRHLIHKALFKNLEAVADHGPPAKPHKLFFLAAVHSLSGSRRQHHRLAAAHFLFHSINPYLSPSFKPGIAFKSNP